MFAEDKLLPISGLQHLVYCARQCALIHVEQVWSENELTASGQMLHKKANSGIDETHRGNRIVRSMDLVSYLHGLVGKADVVEFTPPPGTSPSITNQLARSNGVPGTWSGWQITPVEYKRGKQKKGKIWGDCDRVQLCAQALCIEEMLGASISVGQLFYGTERRRVDVLIDNKLRSRTIQLAAEMHQLLNSVSLPPPVNDRRCLRCSLSSICMPQQVHSSTKASRWLSKQIEMLLESPE